MSGWKAIAVVAALTGCAGVQTRPQRDSASGHWIGEIDRDGWRQVVSLDIESDNGAYRGQWQPVKATPKQALENVDVQGDQVRFETDKLRFVGHVSGSRLSGTVTDKVADAPIGEFAATHDPQRVVYDPGSEWSIPDLP
jgi:hypothetical protein